MNVKFKRKMKTTINGICVLWVHLILRDAYERNGESGSGISVLITWYCCPWLMCVACVCECEWVCLCDTRLCCCAFVCAGVEICIQIIHMFISRLVRTERMNNHMNELKFQSSVLDNKQTFSIRTIHSPTINETAKYRFSLIYSIRFDSKEMIVKFIALWSLAVRNSAFCGFHFTWASARPRFPQLNTLDSRTWMQSKLFWNLQDLYAYSFRQIYFSFLMGSVQT